MKLTVTVYALVIFIYTLLRTALFFSQANENTLVGADFGTIISAFVMGLRFDLVITGYIMIFPFLVLSVMQALNRPSAWVYSCLKWWIFLFFAASFAIGAADIPFFAQFNARFSMMAFQWIDSPLFVIRMIIGDARYVAYLLALIALLIVFWLLLKRIIVCPAPCKNFGRTRILQSAGISLVALLLIFGGIRGRLAEKSPIRIGTAYFSNNQFLNQLGLNPTFTLFRSMSVPKSKNTELMDSRTAISNVQRYLDFTPVSSDFPLARNVVPDTAATVKRNVVIVIMESMSAARMKRFGCKENLTPFLDSLATVGYSFDHCYSAGIHTYNGIFSTSFSYPALFHYHPMKDVAMLRYNGMAHTLRKQGYATVFSITHDGQFDNMEGFLRRNDYEQVITQADYPQSEVRSTLGVPDDYMFRFVVPRLSEIHRQGKPFFAEFMTASNHTPIIIPEYFTPHAEDLHNKAIEFADWSIRRFLTLASREEWFDNTLFVFVADHGGPFAPKYEMPLNYHHSPLIIFAPKLIKPKTFEQFTCQFDVFPTVMGLLKLPYVNNTLGTDVIANPRPYAYFCADNKYGVINSDYFLIVKESGEEALYHYPDRDTRNVIEQNRALADSMRNYALSNMQAEQYVITHGKQWYE